MSIRMNPINSSALAAYASNRIGNLGLDFGEIRAPTIVPQDTGLGQLGKALGGALQGIAARKHQAAQQDKALAAKMAMQKQAQTAQALQAAKRFAQQKELTMMRQAKAKELLEMKLEAKKQERSHKMAKEKQESDIKKRYVFASNYLNSPDVVNDIEKSNAYFKYGKKTDILTEDEYDYLSNLNPKQRAIEIKMDMLTAATALGLKVDKDAMGSGTGGKKKGMGVEAAGKAAGLEVGYEDINRAQEIFMSEDGSPINNLNIWAGQDYSFIVPGTEFQIGPSGIPGTKGREARQALSRSLNTKLRIESGAAVPTDELQRYEAMFMPSPFDTNRGVELKFETLKKWYRSVHEKLNPNMSPKERLEAAYQHAQEVAKETGLADLNNQLQKTADKYEITTDQAQKAIKLIEAGISKDEALRRVKRGEE